VEKETMKQNGKQEKGDAPEKPDKLETPEEAKKPEVAVVARKQAAKLSPRAGSGITYELGRLEGEAFIRIAANDSGGRHSKEWIALGRIREAMGKEILEGKPFAASAMADVFVSRSQNNPGFLVAALRAEGIVKPSPSQPMMSILSGDMEAWIKKVQALPIPKPKASDTQANTPANAPAPDAKDAEAAKGKAKDGK
jgi:hypothetical protein